jgi:hypothetical protein
MLKSKLLSVVAACTLLATVFAANAQPVVDQSQLTFNTEVPFVFSPTDPNYPVGQSFTAGISGLLTDINVFSDGGIESGTDLVTLNVLAGNGVSGALLGTEIDLAASVYNATLGLYFVTLDTSAMGIDVTSGSQYTFDITNVTGAGDLAARGILATTNNPYAGGQIYTGPGYGSPATWDLAFQTTVGTVPEPQSTPLLLIGLGLLGFAIHRKKQG